MSTPTIDDIPAPAREAVERYLAEVTSAMRGSDADVRAATIDDLRDHFCFGLAPDATESDVAKIVAELGVPASFGNADAARAADDDDALGAGTILGIPYDVRVPTAERVARRWWNPHDRRIFVPRVFGIGWDLNFGAIAVRTGLLEPDSEDEPFGLVPRWAFLVALAVPVGLTVCMLGSYVVLQGSLGASLPVHWDLAGEPDDYWATLQAFGFLLAMAAAPAVWAAVSVARRRPPLNQGAVIALAALFAALSCSLWALTLVTEFTGYAAWWLPPLFILPAVAVPLVVLVGLSRVGRRAEMRRDLDANVGREGQ